ncbi:MAG: ABC transporter substrate-binding protein, partial [Micrococcales bacterium]|nr:ABC transporter substrate-binding protein [Micrococcales bacterium]
DKEALSKIAQVWNTDFDITAMPSGDDAELALSCGAFLIKDIVQDQYVTFAKNPDYTWGPEPKVDEIIVRYNEDPMAQVQALQNGELDIIHPQVTTDVLQAVEGMAGVQFESGTEGTYEHIDLTFNNGGPFDPATYGGDGEKAKKVRLAFLKTIPRQQIIDKLIVPLQPDATTRDSFNLVPGAPGYDETIAANGSADFAEVDIEGAKALLAEAGVTDLKVRFLYGKSNVRRAQQFQLISESAAQAGIEVVDNGSDDWGSMLGDGSYDATLFGWQSVTTGMSDSAATFMTGGQNNFSGYTNPKVDAGYEELQVTLDHDKQIEINIGIESELWADAYGVVNFQFPAVTAWNEKVSPVSATAIYATVFWNFWEWEV